MEFRILDIFCGAGGFSAGFEQNQNFKTKIAVDIDKFVLETFKFNFPEAKIINGDIRENITKNEIIKLSKKLKINMIIGGPPCQGFSLKGKQLGLQDPRNFLFLEFIELVNKIKPEIFVIENVKNLIYCSNGYFIKEIQEKFSNMGYIVNFGILNAKDFGVPQNRERAIIIGSLNKFIDLPISHKPKNITIHDAISDLNYLESGEGEFESNYIMKPLSQYQIDRRNNSDKLYNHKATNHSLFAIKKLKLIPPECDKKSLPKKYWGRQKFNSTWSRLQWNSISPTIDTRFDTPSNGKNSHPILNRSITPREAARIQSFNDNFVFVGKKTNICKQIGNAVPPLLGKAIADQIYSIYSIKNKNIISKEYSIYNDDCLKFVKKAITSKLKVNHIITDPPYNISKENNFNTLSNRKGIYFGDWDNNFNYLSWIKDYLKLLDKDGSIIIFCSYLFLSSIINELENNNIIVKDLIIWKKTNPMPRNTERRYVQDMEFAIWGVNKNSKWIFNKKKNQPYLRSLFEFPIVTGKNRFHPTQKNLELMEELILIHTKKDDLILDPFMGSGTTGVAAIKNNRKFIGIEKDESYFNISKNRLETKK